MKIIKNVPVIVVTLACNNVLVTSFRVTIDSHIVEFNSMVSRILQSLRCLNHLGVELFAVSNTAEFCEYFMLLLKCLSVIGILLMT